MKRNRLTLRAAVVAAFLFIMPAVPVLETLAVLTADARRSRNARRTRRKAATAAEPAKPVPDFAFPETVQKEAKVKLETALASGKDAEALEAALQVVVARNSVDSDTFGGNVGFLDSVAAQLRQPWRSMALLTEAKMYLAKRDAARVLQLVMEARGGFHDAKALAASEAGNLISDCDEASEMGLSLYDVFMGEAATILREAGHGKVYGIIPFFDVSQSDFDPEVRCGKYASSLTETLLKECSGTGNPAATVYAVCQRAKDMREDGERVSLLSDWSRKLKDSKWDSFLLRALLETRTGESMDEVVEKTAREWLAKFPASKYSPMVRMALAEATRPSASLSLPSMAVPGMPVKGSFRLANMAKGWVNVYKIPASSLAMNSLKGNSLPSGSQLIATVELNGKDGDFEIPGLKSGNYLCVPSQAKASGKSKPTVKRNESCVLNVTGVSILFTDDRAKGNGALLYAVESRTQKPVAGANVRLYDDDGKAVSPAKTGVTAPDGSFPIPEGNWRVNVRNGSGSVWEWTDSHYFPGGKRNNAGVSLLTDLSVYRPGDSIRFAAVVWKSDGHNGESLKDEKIRVVLKGADYRGMDTLEIETDRFGRAHGAFLIPEGKLSGRWKLDATLPSQGPRATGMAWVQVEEYSLPGFFVGLTKEKDGYNDSIRFSGSAQTFSGMPVGEAPVRYKINWTPWWGRGYAGSPASYSAECRTDESGKFNIALPVENLLGTYFENGAFTISASVTSGSGETRESAPLRFSLGNGYTLSPEIRPKTRVDGDSVEFSAEVLDILGNPVAKPVEYRILSLPDSVRVASGVFESPLLKVASAELPSGEYLLEFSCDGSVAQSRTVLYRTYDTRVPVKCPLWIPENEIIVPEKSGSSTISFGSGWTGDFVYCQIATEAGVVERKWIEMPDTMMKLAVPAPEKDSRIWVTLSGMHCLDRATETITLIPETQTRKLGISTETFRNDITAGNREKWRFRFSLSGMSSGELPAFAVMSDKALNAVSSFDWHLGFDKGWWRNPSVVNAIGSYERYANGWFGRIPKAKIYSLPDFSLNTWGMPLAGKGLFGSRLYNRAMMKSAQTEEMILDDGAVMLDAEPMVMESKAMATGAVAVCDAVMEESADKGEEENHLANVALRPSELPLAFFKPSLVTNPDGNLEVEFTVPDFNTTWQFQLAGYDSDLNAAWLSLDAVAAKAVMAKGNMPHFLRSGDRASVSALLFNNSGKPFGIAGRIEVLNPLDSSVVAHCDFKPEEVRAKGNRTVSLEFEVPDNAGILAVRTYAYGDGHSDGEQAFVGVLPAATPVIDSFAFCLTEGEVSFSLKLPKFSKKDIVALTYCSDPVWEAALALPSTIESSSPDLLARLRTLCGYSIASQLVKKYPALRFRLETTLREKDNVMSGLAKDASFKAVALEATPWTSNALSDSDRLRALDNLLDSQRSEEATGKLLKTVSDRQNADGGWGWCPGMPSSGYITRRALGLLADMSGYGALPPEALKTARKAVSYCDRQILEEIKRNKGMFDTVGLMGYFEAGVRLGLHASGGEISRIRREVLKGVIDKWERFAPADKATAALLLNSEKGYAGMSRVILESLEQTASKSPFGWHYDVVGDGWIPRALMTNARVLDAFVQINPTSPAVAALRQWMLVQKETQDWGEVPESALVVGAIVNSGIKSLPEELTFEARCGKKVIVRDDGQSPSGTSWPDQKEISGKTLEISTSGNVPVWGAVISKRNVPVADVSSISTPELSVSKEWFVVCDDGGGETLEKKTPVVGDRLRIVINVVCRKDMDYVSVRDSRSACLEPADQHSGYTALDGVWGYKSVGNASTSFYIDRLPKGTTVITYDCFVTRPGEYALGEASVQSLYAPGQSAHSAGSLLISHP